MRACMIHVCLQAPIPLCRLPREVRDKPVTSPLAQLPLSRRDGIWANSYRDNEMN